MTVLFSCRQQLHLCDDAAPFSLIHKCLVNIPKAFDVMSQTPHFRPARTIAQRCLVVNPFGKQGGRRMLRNERVFAGLWPKIRKQPFCNGLVVASGKAAILAKAYVRRYDKPPFAPRQDLGQIMDGVPFLVFPFIAGPTKRGRARFAPVAVAASGGGASGAAAQGVSQHLSNPTIAHIVTGGIGFRG